MMRRTSAGIAGRHARAEERRDVDVQGHHGVERFAMSYLTSGRDLLRMQVGRTSRSEPVIVAVERLLRPAGAETLVMSFWTISDAIT